MNGPPVFPDRTIFGFRVSFLWGVVVGALLVLVVLLWLGVVRRALADPCAARPTYLAAVGALAGPSCSDTCRTALRAVGVHEFVEDGVEGVSVEAADRLALGPHLEDVRDVVVVEEDRAARRVDRYGRADDPGRQVGLGDPSVHEPGGVLEAAYVSGLFGEDEEGDGLAAAVARDELAPDPPLRRCLVPWCQRPGGRAGAEPTRGDGPLELG